MSSSVAVVRRSEEEQVRLEAMVREVFEHRMPFNEVLGLRVESFDPVSPRLIFDMRRELVGNIQYNRLHGGAIAAALDTVGGLAVTVAVAEKHANETAEQVAGRFGRFGTIDMRIDYLHQGCGSSFCASATVARLGGRIASVQMELRNDAGLLIATGSAAYVVS